MRPSVLAALALLALLVVPASAVRVERLPLTSGAKVRGVVPAAAAFEAVAAEEAIVWFDASVSTAERTALIAGIGGRIIREQPAYGWVHAGLAAGSSVTDGLAALRSASGVLRAEPNRVYAAVRAPNDPLFASQYHFNKIDAPAAWEFEVGTSCLTTIAIIDTGVEGTHPDLQTKLAGLTQRECVTAGCAPEAGGAAAAACEHGTEVAGLAAAATDNGSQVAGLSWGSQLLSMRVFSTADCESDCGDKGSQSCATSDARIVDALAFLGNLQNTAAYGRIVANLSLGCLPGFGCAACPAALQPAIDASLAKGIVIVAAAGNDGPGDDTMNVPGACPGVIPAGATDINDAAASFSSRGLELAGNGLSAPGDGLTSTSLGGTTKGGLRGTSFASPLVAAAASLVLSAKPAATVNGTTNEVKNILRGTADNVGCSANACGAGRLNAFRALRYTVKGTLAGFDGESKPIAFPNPFRVSKAGLVSFSIPPSLQGSGMKIKIYALDGQLVREITGLVWDGKSDQGDLVASGTYVFQVSSNGGRGRGRLAVIR